MEKPVILKLADFQEQLVNLCNNSQLPAFLMQGVVEKVYNSICELSLKEYQTEKENFEKKEVKENGKGTTRKITN